MQVALQVIQIVLSVTMAALVLMQAKGSGLGNVFGGAGGVYRTRRGVEKTLFQSTIVVGVLFCLTALAAVATLPA